MVCPPSPILTIVTELLLACGAVLALGSTKERKENKTRGSGLGGYIEGRGAGLYRQWWLV